MLLGPIFQVEMVSTARRKRYFLLRVLYALLILLVLWISYETSDVRYSYSRNASSIQQGAQLATFFFVSFSWLQMMAILTVGPALAVGTIAVERERRTIEYLFATDLANHEIVLGKTFARLMLLGKLVLVGLPILFLFRLLGGIPTNLLLATFLLAASSAVMITALSLFVSVWSPRVRDATVRVYLLLAALLLVPLVLMTLDPFLRAGLATGQTWQLLVSPVVDACLVINPMWALGRAMGNVTSIGLGLDMSVVLWTVGWQLVMSIAALFWATAAVRRVHLGQATRGETRYKRSWNYRFPQWRPALQTNAMVWKEMFAGSARTRLGMIGAVAVTVILLTVMGLTVFTFIMSQEYVKPGRPSEFFTYLATLTGILGSCILLLLAARAAGLVTSEKERDCWSSLLATPLSGREIMTGMMWGNLYGVRWPFFVMASAWALGLILEPTFAIAIVAMTGTFLLLAWYVTNLGLCFSLRSQTSLRAMGSTIGTLVFTAGGYLFCCCTMMAGSGGPSDALAIMLAPCIPYLLGFPPAAYYAYMNDAFFENTQGFPVAYGFGIMIYVVATVILYAHMTTNFDRLSGRCGERLELN